MGNDFYEILAEKNLYKMNATRSNADFEQLAYFGVTQPKSNIPKECQ